MLVVGVDLAGVARRPSGFCVLRDLAAETCLLFSDEAIVEAVVSAAPSVVAVDAPLSLPPGRCSIDDASGEHLRLCDRELLRRGIRFFPVTLGPMRGLTARGIRLRGRLEALGYRVVEVYPGGAQDVLGVPRKRVGLDALRAGLEGLGIKGLSAGMSDHELDAVTCAYVGYLLLEGRAVCYGAGDEVIVMPRGENLMRGARRQKRSPRQAHDFSHG